MMLPNLLFGTLLLLANTTAQEPTHPAAKSSPKEDAKKVQQESAAAIIERRLGLKFSILGSKIRRRIISTKTPYGFSVKKVTKDSPADERELARGAIVLEVDGKPLHEISELARVLRKKKAGDVVKLSCARRKKQRRLLDRKPWEHVVIELKLKAPIDQPAKKPEKKRPKAKKTRRMLL